MNMEQTGESTEQGEVAPLRKLLPKCWEKNVGKWLTEDIPSFDYGGYVVGTKQERAILKGKSPGVVAGVPFFDAIFKEVNCRVEWKLKEGDFFTPPEDSFEAVGYVYGQCCDILAGERTALNLLARASGIATFSRRLKNLAQQHGFNGAIAGTRKTTPGFRLVEKYAMLVGGIDTHRYDLSSMVMLKDNHIMSAGSITNAVQKARSVCGFSIKIEVECQNIDEAREALTAKADIAMLDNYSPSQLKKEAAILKNEFPHSLIEASGGITEESIAEYFDEAVDIISLGAVTQGVPHVDFSLKIMKH